MEAPGVDVEPCGGCEAACCSICAPTVSTVCSFSGKESISSLSSVYRLGGRRSRRLGLPDALNFRGM